MLLTIQILDSEAHENNLDYLIDKFKSEQTPYFVISQKDGRKFKLIKSWKNDQVPAPHSLLPKLIYLMVSHPCFGVTPFIMTGMYSEVLNLIGVKMSELLRLNEAFCAKKTIVSTFKDDYSQDSAKTLQQDSSQIRISIKDGCNKLIEKSLVNLFQLSDHQCQRKNRQCIS
jgi:hypothetical protein